MSENDSNVQKITFFFCVLCIFRTWMATASYPMCSLRKGIGASYGFKRIPSPYCGLETNKMVTIIPVKIFSLDFN